ncbi:MAG: glycosyltransferase [Acidobacteriota bacterium]|nr:glycosyltransferase [Acidobacteriota bacterium]
MNVSVVMPVYNAAETVAEAVASIQAQTYRDWELVAVDDGSLDQSAAVLEALVSGDPRIRVLRIPHQGIVAALNHGIQASRASLIARMDADDLCLPERLEKQVAAMQADPTLGLIAARATYGGDTESFQGFNLFVDWTNELLTGDRIALDRFVESPLIHPTVMFRKHLVDRYGGYRDGPFPEDYELWLRWLDAGVRMAKLPDKLFIWRERETRLTRTDPRYSVDAFYAVKTKYLARHLHRSGIDRVVVWGAGRISRKRAELLTDHGIQIVAYVDIDPKKVGQVIRDRPVWDKTQLPEPGDCFVLAYVGNRGARNLIREFLEGLGYRIGRHYLLAA